MAEGTLTLKSKDDDGSTDNSEFDIIEIEQCESDMQSASFRCRELLPGWPRSVQPIVNECDIQSGTHVVFKITSPQFRAKFQSALVGTVQSKHVQVIMNCANDGGVVEKSILFCDLLKRAVHKIAYTGQLYDDKQAVERAKIRLKHDEKCYHVLKNNSHFFVTSCITGREQSLADILRALEDSQSESQKVGRIDKKQEVRVELEVEKRQKIEKEPKVKKEQAVEREGLKPIFYQIPIPSRRNLQSGDHLSDGSQHYLVESVSEVNDKFSAYTLDKDNKVNLIHNVLLSSCMLRVELGGDHRKPSLKQVLKKAQEHISSEWISPEYFVTEMKYGTGFLFDNIQCFVLDKEITCELKVITPEVKITEGDHLMIRDYRNPDYFHSGIVYSCPDHTRVSIMPQVGLMGVLDLTLLPEVYRVEYSTSLPSNETLLCARSKQGEKILMKSPNEYSCFINWVKTGQTKHISPPIGIINSKCYEKVTCCSQIQKGDHLMQLKHPERYPHGLRHLLITECADDSSKHKVLFCKQNYLCEQDKKLNGELYIVKCESDEGLVPDDVVERGRKQIGQKYSPWDRMLFIAQAKCHQTEETSASRSKHIFFSQQPCVSPSSKSRIMCFKQVSPGDYIVKEPTAFNKKIDSCHHYLVVAIHGSPTHCKVIESNSGKVIKSHCIIETDTERADYIYYRINYKPGTCIPAEKSIEAAKEMVDKQLHIGSNRFVHFLKTKNMMQVTLSKLRDERDHLQQIKICLSSNAPLLGYPVESCRITTINKNFTVGTHILYKATDTLPSSYCSALVIGVQQDQSNEVILEFVTNTMKDGITKQSAKFKDLENLNEVVYLSAPTSKKQAVATAVEHLKYEENFFHPKHYNSHHFVTICVTGCEHSLVDILARIQCEEHQGNQERGLKPILFKVEVNSLDDINPADHVMIDRQHYLVKSKDTDNDTFSAYTVDKSDLKFIVKKNWRESVRIEYCVYGSELFQPSRALEMAEIELTKHSKWKYSEGFVTKMKCGSEYGFDDCCLMSNNVKVLSYTEITPHISIDEGDHLVLLENSTQSQYHSVLVCKCIDSKTVDIMPPISSTSLSTSMIVEQEELDLSNYTVYRVNYSQCLPSEYVLERARSVTGRDILVACANPHCFITWAKTGKKLDMPEEFPEKPSLRITDICPLRYEKIMSSDDIQIGDHLFTITKFIDYEVRRKHFLVSETVADTLFKVIYLSDVGYLKETKHEFNPYILKPGTQVYRVVYPEAFTCQLSIKRMRSQFNKRHMLTGAALLIRWAKTGSEEGLEIDFLINSSAPTSKSQIACFTQLNPGDYLIKESSILSPLNHHYLIVSINSPTECRVIESWRRKVEEKLITCNNWPNESTYYRINYNPGHCIKAEQSIKIARDACTNPKFFSRYWKPNSTCARESFVHFVKTGETSLDIENLQDDRLFLQREPIKSAFDLCVGDHIERPLAIAPSSDAKHHMLIIKPISHTACLVIHYKVEKSVTHTQKGDIVCEVVDIFEHGDVYQIVYPERTDPKDGIGKLASRLSKDDRDRLQNEVQELAKELCYLDDRDKARLQSEIEYHLKNNNCEHLIMFATIGIPMSIQVNKIIRHALICTKRSLRAFRGSIIHRSAKCAPNDVMHKIMSVACKHSSKTAASISALALAGGIDFAVSLAVELPLLAYNIHKLRKKARFRMISEEEFKRQVLKEVLVGCGVVTDGTAGTIAGQAIIPLPVLGAVAGGLLGGLIGQGCGTVAGNLLGCLIKEKELALPKTLSYSYNSLLEY